MNKIFNTLGAFGIAIGIVFAISFPYFIIAMIIGYMIIKERRISY